MATREANAHPEYMNALVRASASDTVITTAYSVMWPDAPHRVRRSCVEAAEALEGDIVGEMPMGVVQMPLVDAQHPRRPSPALRAAPRSADTRA